MRSPEEFSKHRRVTVLDKSDYGLAAIVARDAGSPLRVVVSWGMNWDHVSVSLKARTPNYQEMKMVKRIFFRPDETAIEYHPAETAYISVNDNVLHLWRPQLRDIPMPPHIMV